MEKKRLTERKRFYLPFTPPGNPAQGDKQPTKGTQKMSKRMPRKPVKASRKSSTAVTMSPAFAAAMFKVANVAANMSRKDEAAQQAARKEHCAQNQICATAQIYAMTEVAVTLKRPCNSRQMSGARLCRSFSCQIRSPGTG